MKPPFLFAIVFLLLTGITACNNHSEKQGKTEYIADSLADKYYKRLEGKIGDKAATLHLIKVPGDKKESFLAQYSGTLLPGDGNAPLAVAGFKNADSSIQLVTYNHYNPIDTLTGHFSGKTFKGKMSDRDSRLFEFSLEEQYPTGSYHWEVAKRVDSLIADSVSTKDIMAKTDLMTLWPGDDIKHESATILTDTICRAFFGMPETYKTPEQLLKTVTDSFLLKYKASVKELLETQKEIRPSFSWNMLTSMNITCNKDHKISLSYTQYQFTGGAHGLQSVFCLNVDTKAEKVLHLSDLFQEGFRKPLQEKLENELRQQYDIPPGEPLNGDTGLLFEAHLPVSNNFYLTPDGIGFIYNPYEVAPYVVGEINLYLPFSKINSILKN